MDAEENSNYSPVVNVTTDRGARLARTENLSQSVLESVCEPMAMAIAESSVGSNGSANCKNSEDASDWYVAVVRACCEKKAEAAILKAGVETWVPSQREKHLWSDRAKWVERIIVPALVFFRTNANTSEHDIRMVFLSILKVSYVYKIMSMPGQSRPAVIPAVQMRRLRFMLGYAASPVNIETNRVIRKGDRVRVVRGKLRGFEGNVCRMPDGKTKLFIAIDYIGCATMQIQPADVEVVE